MAIDPNWFILIAAAACVLLILVGIWILQASGEAFLGVNILRIPLPWLHPFRGISFRATNPFKKKNKKEEKEEAAPVGNAA